MTAAQMWKNVLGRRTAWALLWSFFIALQTLQPAKKLLLAGLEPASSSLILLPSLPFPFVSDKQKCICLDTGQTTAKCVTR